MSETFLSVEPDTNRGSTPYCLVCSYPMNRIWAVRHSSDSVTDGRDRTCRYRPATASDDRSQCVKVYACTDRGHGIDGCGTFIIV